MSDTLIRVAKGGDHLLIHPTCLVSHQAMGWAVAPAEFLDVPEAVAALVEPASFPAEIPADWQSAHWKTRVALAKAISGEEPADAKVANDVIEAELKNRALDAPQETANGLTLRQLRADIAGLGLDVDPTMSPADLLALRDLHREDRAKAAE